MIVKTGLKEFDYPLGDDNQEYVYEGDGGIPMTFGNKLLLAIGDKQFRYLLSDYITKRVFIWKHVIFGNVCKELHLFYILIKTLI